MRAELESSASLWYILTGIITPVREDDRSNESGVTESKRGITSANSGVFCSTDNRRYPLCLLKHDRSSQPGHLLGRGSMSRAHQSHRSSVNTFACSDV
ncbi:hypothetical protein T265_05135 [Opisthorchis viverrini]|uniref:Uncharacterized protein n=1 Tax=Opisthorchis viverrini TaxID=6198 RepID=A0A074ZKR9_OPIVI|nr:hypothetical protein T265_05135 [Opisthorchis viverrini]KER27933.1 hypothetical protein T265_05135 [Opisthorchis viverrini]